MYKENPKTKGSGIICAIPQTGTCPNKCDDCFFQSGRSYLEPLSENLPNMPSQVEAVNKVVRINDGNDSNVDSHNVIEKTDIYPMKFYNTAIPSGLEKFKPDPVVLTVNPASMTDNDFFKVDPIPENLMMVRFRANMWNQEIGDEVVEYYTNYYIPVIFTFMAYYNENIPSGWKSLYTYRKRTLNSYWVLTQDGHDDIMRPYKNNEYVYTCGKNADSFPCHRCGNCLREYFATINKSNQGGIYIWKNTS